MPGAPASPLTVEVMAQHADALWSGHHRPAEEPSCSTWARTSIDEGLAGAGIAT